MPPNLQPEKSRYAWAPALLAFCKGFPLSQIAEVYQIPLRTLEARALNEHWATLAAELPLQKLEGVGTARKELRASIERIEENRDRNLRVMQGLRRVIEEKVDAFQKGELKVEKVFFHAKTGELVKGESAAGTAELLALANAAKVVSEGTYRALGDVVAAEEARGKSTSPQLGQISIFLPSLTISGAGKPAPWDTATEAKAVEVVSPPAQNNGSQ